MPLRIVRNDIVKMTTDAIVNTANDHVVVGTGCDGAVYRAAGYDELLNYRREYIGFVEEGGAIDHIANVHRYAREEDRPEKTLFIITTDGMENSSRMYTYKMVKKMVEKEKKKYGWEFLFLGANIDAIETAGRFGIGADRAFNYECDSVGVSLNYQAISQTVSAVRRSTSKEELDNAVYASCETIRDDYKRRHGKQEI